MNDLPSQVEKDLDQIIIDMFLDMNDDERKYVYRKTKQYPIVKYAYKYVKELSKQWKDQNAVTPQSS